MSAFSSIALPGNIPMSGPGKGSITPEALFKSSSERALYKKLLDGDVINRTPPVKVKNVKVRIFDLSDPEQVSEYEKLWKELIDKTYRMEVVVDSRKDLVHRKDGTSYWMKYVEYVEFDDASEDADSGKDDK